MSNASLKAAASFVLLLPLLVSCGPKGLTEAEQRAAKAHADNLCLMASMPEDAPFDANFAQTIAGSADIHAVVSPSDPATAVITEGTRMARERGCVK